MLAGFNDLATLLPDIAAEWSDRNYPLLPTQVTVFANRKVASYGMQEKRDLHYLLLNGRRIEKR